MHISRRHSALAVAALALAVAALALAAWPARAHGDEDHSQDAKKPGTGSASTLAEAAAGGSTAPQRLADGSLFVAKPVQRQLALRTQRVRIGDLAATTELNGEVIAGPNAGGRLQATFAGIVVPGPRGLPVLGQRVAKGELLAHLRPIGSTIERGNQRAQLAELEAQLAVAERRLARLDQLEGAVPRKEIEAARIERDALIQRRGFVGDSIDRAEPLRAPAAGIVSSTQMMAGQVVDAKEVLLDIIDPARLSVEALAYDAGIAASVVSAVAVSDQFTLELKFIGAGRQLHQQALPLLFRIATPNSMVAVGQPLKVIVRTALAIRGAAVPRSALTRNAAGETMVWVHGQAERFEARRIRHQGLDGDRVAVTEGLHDGDRVVVEGAGLLSQVR